MNTSSLLGNRWLGQRATYWFLTLLAFAPLCSQGRTGDGGDLVVVIYNSRLPESKEVADHYATRRAVPPSQVIGLDLPVVEGMTHDEYLQKLLRPLIKSMTDAHLIGWGKANEAGDLRVTESKVRYAALCYGVPVKVFNDPAIKEPTSQSFEEPLRRADCSVDSQLALLPWGEKAPWIGFVPNRFYGATNTLYMHPTNGLLLVSRLDGPTPALAKGLVDKALEAETNGLWGRAYFDARGLTNGPYLEGDNWIRSSAQLLGRLGFEVSLDDREPTFTSGYPLSDVAFYAGWYDANVSGPFTRPTVEFVPGAFAYHLHSYSAAVLRTPSAHWVGPLIAKGATASIGYVEEPFLSLTLDLHAFFGRFVFFGNTFAEAAYAGQKALSWQATVVGDPLYRPFWQTTDRQEKELGAKNSPLLAWSNLMEANQNLAVGADKQTVIKFLQKVPSRHSPILQEKVADLFLEQKRFNLAAETYEEVLKVSTSPGQRLRVLLALGEVRSIYGPDQRAYDAYQTLLKEFPDYPDKVSVYRKLLPLAKRMGKKEEEDKISRELSAAGAAGSK